MYNPTHGAKSPYKQTVVDQTKSLRHSEIVKARGVGQLAPIGDKVPTSHGFDVIIFESKAFTIRYSLISATNSIGYGYNTKYDRSIRVLSGTLYVSTENDQKEKIFVKLVAGMVYNAPAKAKYGFATSQEAVELYIVEDAKYPKCWESLEEPVETASNASLAFAKAEPIARVGNTEQTKQQALDISNQKLRRAKQSQARAEAGPVNDNPNSAASMGVNPRPLGPAFFNDD